MRVERGPRAAFAPENRAQALMPPDRFAPGVSGRGAPAERRRTPLWWISIVFGACAVVGADPLVTVTDHRGTPLAGIELHASDGKHHGPRTTTAADGTARLPWDRALGPPRSIHFTRHGVVEGWRPFDGGATTIRIRALSRGPEHLWRFLPAWFGFDPGQLPSASRADVHRAAARAPDRVHARNETPADYYVAGYARRERPNPGSVEIWLARHCVLYVWYDDQDRVVDWFAGPPVAGP